MTKDTEVSHALLCSAYYVMFPVPEKIMPILNSSVRGSFNF